MIVQDGGHARHAPALPSAPLPGTNVSKHDWSPTRFQFELISFSGREIVPVIALLRELTDVSVARSP